MPNPLHRIFLSNSLNNSEIHVQSWFVFIKGEFGAWRDWVSQPGAQFPRGGTRIQSQVAWIWPCNPCLAACCPPLCRAMLSVALWGRRTGSEIISSPQSQPLSSALMPSLSSDLCREENRFSVSFPTYSWSCPSALHQLVDDAMTQVKHGEGESWSREQNQCQFLIKIEVCLSLIQVKFDLRTHTNHKHAHETFFL